MATAGDSVTEHSLELFKALIGLAAKHRLYHILDSAFRQAQPAPSKCAV